MFYNIFKFISLKTNIIIHHIVVLLCGKLSTKLSFCVVKNFLRINN